MSSPEERITSLSRSTDMPLHAVVSSTEIDQSTTPNKAGDIDQQILELKKKQELQKQMLLHSFQEQTKQLELQHKMQLEHKYQYAVHSTHGDFQELRDQRLVASAEEQQKRECREREILKRKENCSANASPEVKQILNSFLMSRKQGTPNVTSITSPFRNRGVVKSSSGESFPASSVTSSHPYKIPQAQLALLKYESDFPLRKTASEPNLLKIRLKQSVIERKVRGSGPTGVRRHERLFQAVQRRQQKQNSVYAGSNCNNPSESNPNSPPLSSYSASIVGRRGSPTSAPIQEETEECMLYQHEGRGSINDLSLFSSPSMPNISLGRPPMLISASSSNANSASNTNIMPAVRQVGVLPLCNIPPTYYNSMPLPCHTKTPLEVCPSLMHAHDTRGSSHSITGMRAATATSTSITATLPSPLLRDLTSSPPQAHTASAGAFKIIKGTAQTSASPSMYSGQSITDTQVARAHLNKQGHRPLGRTQSAPLPLVHPMLIGNGQLNINPTHYENVDAERQAYEQQHFYLTQKIRKTVLTRTKAARETQLKEEDDSIEVIDLTKKKPPSPQQDLPLSTLPPSSACQSFTEPISEILPITTTNNIIKSGRDYNLQQQRELLHMQSLQDSETVDKSDMRPLSRTLSSPLVYLNVYGLRQMPDTGQQHSIPIATSYFHTADQTPPVNLSMQQNNYNLVDCTTKKSLHSSAAVHKKTTGLAYDNLMLRHGCICGNNSIHVEHSGRLQSVWARLVETNLAKRCDRLRSRKATLEELQIIHTEAHALLFGSYQSLNRQKLENSPVSSFVRLSCGGVGVDLDTTWNEQHTAIAARMAAGCVIDLAFKTANGDIKNGFAVVRPPGHHAESNLAMGFCFFNSIAVAAKLLLQRLPDIRRVLIVDWDVHHGNGTQQAFYDNPNVLYISIHRHDDGNFFPGTGGPTECGENLGLGFNVNISWSGALNPPLGDAEYIAAFRTIVMPIARSFDPDIVLVSCGFDAAAGHPAPLGGYLVSPACFGFMTGELMQLANGKVILALEGGYDLPAICDSAQECVRTLLGDKPTSLSQEELHRPPCQNAINTLQKTLAIQLLHWPCLRPLARTVAMSAIEANKGEPDDSETVSAMAGLSMQTLKRSLSQDIPEEPMDQDEHK